MGYIFLHDSRGFEPGGKDGAEDCVAKNSFGESHTRSDSKIGLHAIWFVSFLYLHLELISERSDTHKVVKSQFPGISQRIFQSEVYRIYSPTFSMTIFFSVLLLVLGMNWF